MASVSKRTDGRPGYVVRWRDEASKQRKKSFAKKALADRFRAEVEHKLNTGSYIDPAAGKVTFRAYAERWRTIQVHRPNTASRIASQLSKHIYPVLGAKPIAAIRPSDVQALATGLAGKLAPGSVRTIMAAAGSVFRAALHDRVIGLNPAERVTLPEVPHKRIVPIEVATVEAIAAAIRPQYRALVVVAAGSGLRRGELFGLRLDDVDFLRRTVRVEQQVQNVAGVPTIAPPKTRGSYRTVPIGDTVARELAEHVRRFPPVDGVLFAAPTGGLINSTSFREFVWLPAVTEAGVASVGLHDCRHFYASVLIGAGQSVKVVAERLGHANAAITLNVYSHLWPADEDKTRQAIDDVFGHKIVSDAPRVRPAMEA